MCLKSITVDEEWEMALDYLKGISSKSASAQQCATILESLHHKLRIPPVRGVMVIVDSATNNQGMAAVQEYRGISDESSSSPVLYPISNVSPFPYSDNAVGWDLQGSTSVNVDWPWDWNIMDNVFAQGIGDRNVGWGEL
jgi:hypothetical protein